MSFGMQKRDKINKFEPKSGSDTGTLTPRKDGKKRSAPSATFSGKGFPNPLIRPHRRFGKPRRMECDLKNEASVNPNKISFGNEPKGSEPPSEMYA